jgi:hypothetical protein
VTVAEKGGPTASPEDQSLDPVRKLQTFTAKVLVLPWIALAVDFLAPPLGDW